MNISKSNVFSSNTKYKLVSSDFMDELALCVLKSLDNLETFCFKGGWVLSKLFPNEFRKTVDIDMSIIDLKYFDIMKDNLIKLCEEWKQDGEIHNYKIKSPEPEKRRSGFVKLYRLRPSGGKYKVSGIDISVKDISNCTVVLNNSIPVFTFERMLADKFKVLHSGKDKISRRIKDVFDISLIIDRVNLNKDILFKLCTSNEVDFSKGIEADCLYWYSNDLEEIWKDYVSTHNINNYTDLKENLIAIRKFEEELLDEYKFK